MQFIRTVEHQRKKPVTVERDVNDVLVIEGVRYAGDLFRTFAEPDDRYLYAMRRDGDTVVLVTVRDVDDARKFFEEAGG
jgi:hypothetical protein